MSSTARRPRRGLLWRAIVRLPVPVRLFLWRLVLAVLPERVRSRIRESVTEGRRADIPLVLDPAAGRPGTPPGRPDVLWLADHESEDRIAEPRERYRLLGHRTFVIQREDRTETSTADLTLPSDSAAALDALATLVRQRGIDDAVAIVANQTLAAVAREAAARQGWPLVDLTSNPEPPATVAELYPLASIVILTYNKLDYTRLCLESIAAKTIYPNYEVIVVDNQSTDETPAFLTGYASELPNVRAILNPSNQGFAGGNNLGARAATGDFLIFLNNDTVVTPTWLSRLLHHLTDPTVGMVSPLTNWAANAAKIETSYASLAEMERFADDYTAERRGQAYETDVLNFYCVALRRSVYDEVGPLDERFGTGMFEDDDYSRRVRAAGYRLLCAEDAFVHHWGNVSFAQLEGKAYLGLVERNRRLYEEKWKTRWTAPTRR